MVGDSPLRILNDCSGAVVGRGVNVVGRLLAGVGYVEKDNLVIGHVLDLRNSKVPLTAVVGDVVGLCTTV